jgi:hypothetical protein
LDERAITLRRLAKFSECGTMCGHLIFHRADCYLLPSRSICWDVSRLSGLCYPWSDYLLVCGADLHRSCALEVPDGHDLRRVVALLFSDTLTEPTQTCLLTASIAPWQGLAPCLCPTLSMRHHIVMLPFFVRRHSYGDYTELSLRSCTNL